MTYLKGGKVGLEVCNFLLRVDGFVGEGVAIYYATEGTGKEALSVLDEIAHHRRFSAATSAAKWEKHH